jgi:hypothetical protein
MSAWTEGRIGTALARGPFAGHLCAVPNCTWIGHECDILVVAKNLKVIDVEVKVSRSDLRADIRKDKWWRRTGFWTGGKRPEPVRIEWPDRVWKHYYCIPSEIWTDDLLDAIPKCSGVLLIRDDGRPVPRVVVRRRVTACPDAKPLKPEAIVTIARLASLRMWDSMLDSEKSRIALSDVLNGRTKGVIA